MDDAVRPVQCIDPSTYRDRICMTACTARSGVLQISQLPLFAINQQVACADVAMHPINQVQQVERCGLHKIK